jgi:hypothetical protein
VCLPVNRVERQLSSLKAPDSSARCHRISSPENQRMQRPDSGTWAKSLPHSDCKSKQAMQPCQTGNLNYFSKFYCKKDTS